MNLIAKDIKKKSRNNKRIDSHLGVPQNARGGNWSQDETKPHNAIIIMSKNKPFQSHRVTYLSAGGPGLRAAYVYRFIKMFLSYII